MISLFFHCFFSLCAAAAASIAFQRWYNDDHDDDDDINGPNYYAMAIILLFFPWNVGFSVWHLFKLCEWMNEWMWNEFCSLEWNWWIELNVLDDFIGLMCVWESVIKFYQFLFSFFSLTNESNFHGQAFVVHLLLLSSSPIQ